MSQTFPLVQNRVRPHKTRLIWGLYTSYAPKDLTEFGWSRDSQLTAVCMGVTMHRTYMQSKGS